MLFPCKIEGYTVNYWYSNIAYIRNNKEGDYVQKDFRFKIISEGLENGVSVTCRKYNISRTLYYRWLKRYKSKGIDGLNDIKKDFVPPNKTSTETENALLSLIKEYPDYGPRALKYLFDELGYNISESAVYNIMTRNNLTKKKHRVHFAMKKDHRITESIPPLTELKSGECWLFWVTNYGYYKTIGNLYEYTLYDLKSQIAATRLYKEVSLKNLEDILTAVAMPVSKSLHLKINFLCFLQDDTILKQLGKTFKSRLNTIISDNGFDFQIHIIPSSNEDLDRIHTFKTTYTDGCLSFLIPYLNQNITFAELKIIFQDYLMDYNVNHKSIFHNMTHSPVEYHNQITNTKLILPIWAYMNRKY